MISDDFLNSLGDLLKYKINRFLKLNADYSFYGDLRNIYDSETKAEFDLYRKRYIADVDSYIMLDTFDIKLTNIEFDVDVGIYEQGEMVFTFMFDIAKLFDDYDEENLFPFYTMLNIQIIFHCYLDDDEDFYSIGNNKYRFKTELDKGLLSRTSNALLEDAITNLNGELTFGILTAS